MFNCLICEANFNSFIDFGKMPIANNFSKNKSTKKDYNFQMSVGFCNSCKSVQLTSQPDRKLMFHENYAFYSSTSSFMKTHFKKFANEMIELQKLDNNSLVVEIGCNDGIMLENFMDENINSFGVEPSKNVAKVAEKKGLNVINDFFSKEIALEILNKFGKSDAILSANVICHIPYIHKIFEGVKLLLNKNGVFAFEEPYLGDVIKKTSFDQIYDEHVFLFSILSVKNIAAMHDLDLFEAQKQITHGGSMRYYLSHKGNKEISSNVLKLINEEKNYGLNKEVTFQDFNKKILRIKNDLINLLMELKNQGKKVVAYGATSKSTTVTNYFGITSDLVECIFDTTPIKHDTFSPGVKIPVLPYKDFRKSNPDYVLLFAWNHFEEIKEKEKDFMTKDKKWILYVPEVKVI